MFEYEITKKLRGAKGVEGGHRGSRGSQGVARSRGGFRSID